ncbi:hypothetical protein [Absidia glauca]|uniref:Uncharacterized protein n=1 Tax=Absidia glauca TaxID=4829 RepID=A0A163JWZ0_ABSGL|nr:hypothetical protein [Absidia glauca]
METLLTDPGVSVMEAHKLSLEGILTRRNKKVQQTKLRMTEYVDSEEVESCQRQIHELDIEATHYMLKRDNVSVDEVAHNWNELKNLTKQQNFLMDRMRKQSAEKSANDRERQLTVCRTCALYIDLNISDERKHIHTQNSTHQAFMKIEAKLAELEKVP